MFVFNSTDSMSKLMFYVYNTLILWVFKVLYK